MKPQILSSRRSFVLSSAASLGLLPILGFAKTKTTRINVADFGAIPNSNVDATAAVQAAINACSKSGAVLRFPHGAYHFSPDKGFVLPFNDFSDLEIDGDGSTLFFSGLASPLEFHAGRVIHLHDLNIDWLRPTFSQGVVVASSSDRLSIDVKIDDEFPITGNEPVFALRYFDRDRRMSVPHIADLSPTSHALIASQTIRYEFPKPIVVVQNSAVVIRHARESVGIIFGESSDLALSKVTLHTAAGMGFVGTKVRNATFTECAVKPKKDGARMMSTTADGMHFWGSRGSFLVEQCEFESTGDDCINIHSFLLALSAISGKRSVTLSTKSFLEGAMSPLNAAQIPIVGDRIEIVDVQRMIPILKAIVVGVNGSLQATQVTLDSDLPGAVETTNLAISGPVPQLTVRTSKFSKGAGCGVVVRSNAAIEGNSFEDLSWAGVNCQVDAYFGEGPTISSIRIEKNDFKNCGHLLPGSLNVTAQVKDANGNLGGSKTPGNRDITILENSFEQSEGVAIVIGQADNVTISHNRITVSETASELPKIIDLIRLADDTHVAGVGNSINGRDISLPPTPPLRR